MRKQQAVICTILFAIVIVIVLTTSFYIKNDEYGISLYQLIMNMIANSAITFNICTLAGDSKILLCKAF